MAIKGIDIIRRWVIQTRLKEQGKQGGVMITLPKKDLVDLNTSITAEKLMRNGIDPNSITSVNQVENIINQINKPRVISQGDPEFSGIMGRLTGSNVIKRDFGKPFKEEIENQKRFFKGVEIKDPKFDENLPFDSDAEKLAEIMISNEAYEQGIAARLKAENKKGLESLKQKMAKEKARTKRISGNLRSENMNRTEIGRPKLDEDEYDYYREILDDDENFVVRGDETKEFLEAMVKEQQDEINYMRRLYDRGALDPKPGERGRKKFLDRKAQKGDEMSQEEIEELKKLSEEPEDLATGGRAGFKMGRRAFLALMGSAGAGIGAAKTGLLKLFGQGAGKQVTKEMVKTPPVAGKPEWFDSLVNKVITQGEDVTKKFATKERQDVYKLQIDEMDDVTVYRNLDDGEIRVSYDSPNNMGEQSVELVFKPGKGQTDEVTGKVADNFYAVEAEPRGIRTGPDDYEIEFDGENLADSVDELVSDTSKLKQVATDKKPTMKEFLESKNKKDKTKAINEDQLEQAEYLETKYGPAPDEGNPSFQNFDRSEDFASGGIARMLGE